jgi:hypothetical protein
MITRGTHILENPHTYSLGFQDKTRPYLLGHYIYKMDYTISIGYNLGN